MHTIDLHGQSYSTGCLPRTTQPGQILLPEGRIEVWGESQIEHCPVIPADQLLPQTGIEWAEYADEDQNGFPSCCLTSLANALEFHQSMEGREKIRLDWHRAWVDLSGGSGGVALDAAHQYARLKGFPIVGSTDRLFVVESWDAATVDQFLSGVEKGCRGTYGRFIGRGGHAEFCAYLIAGSGGVVPRIRGSWGRSYGQAGWYDVPLADLRRGIPYFGAILIRETQIRAADAAGLIDARG